MNEKDNVIVEIILTSFLLQLSENSQFHENHCDFSQFLSYRTRSWKWQKKTLSRMHTWMFIVKTYMYLYCRPQWSLKSSLTVVIVRCYITYGNVITRSSLYCSGFPPQRHRCFSSFILQDNGPNWDILSFWLNSPDFLLLKIYKLFTMLEEWQMDCEVQAMIWKKS